MENLNKKGKIAGWTSLAAVFISCIFGIRRTDRLAAVDAFLYKKVYLQREMTENAQSLDFGKADDGVTEYNEHEGTFEFEPS